MLLTPRALAAAWLSPPAPLAPWQTPAAASACAARRTCARDRVAASTAAAAAPPRRPPPGCRPLPAHRTRAAALCRGGATGQGVGGPARVASDPCGKAPRVQSVMQVCQTDGGRVGWRRVPVALVHVLVQVVLRQKRLCEGESTAESQQRIYRYRIWSSGTVCSTWVQDQIGSGAGSGDGSGTCLAAHPTGPGAIAQLPSGPLGD